MKKTLLFLLLIISGVMQAQIVNIPDANFKNFLIQAVDLDDGEPIDTNGNGEIEMSEAENVNALQITEVYNPPIINIEGIGAFTNVEALDITLSHLPAIDISALTNLVSLIINDAALVDLNINGLINLETFNLASSSIGSLDISQLQSLTTIRVFSGTNNTLTSLNVGSNPNLDLISVSSTGIESLDLSGCPNIATFSFNFGGSHDVFLNIKNGDASYDWPISSTWVYFDNDEGHKCYICIDEGEEFQNVSDNVIFSTYCTFTPGGDYNVITGSLLFDNEGDGCDTNDTVIRNIKLNINDGTESGSTVSTTGLYNFYTQEGTYTITPDFENDLFTITPPFAEINFTEVDSLVTTQNFCLTPNGNHPDLDIVIVPFGARPGFDADYKIIYRNKGNQTLSGDIVFAYGEDVLDFVSANPSEDSSSSGNLIWNYTGLAPFQQREIFVTLNVNGPMETPAVNIDDNLEFTATINPVMGDDTPLDNIFGLKQTVIGSFDPNDITCLEGDSVNPDRIGEYLHYNINFENTGTAPATFIVVKDVIDTTQFDMATLQMLNASHPVQAKITGNKVEFRFDDINLGPEGKGNVVFKIKPLNTLQVNDDVTQQADIFFDYNWPIQTNEATTVFEVLSRGEFEKDNSVKVYPNPSNGMVNITAASEIRSVELYDIQGRLLQAGSNDSLDISGRAAGMYFVKVLTEAGMKVEKVLKSNSLIYNYLKP
ncbi:T9SS type A sorting domain-containing protein [Flavobacterium sp. DGU11]|uniref:T9SS type A sorting domain-containing protein n=1 Tax=Flavobacterium arundinis TaxID=3139143 RepID=A0ABU9HTN6_9FLAO